MEQNAIAQTIYGVSDDFEVIRHTPNLTCVHLIGPSRLVKTFLSMSVSIVQSLQEFEQIKPSGIQNHIKVSV